MYLPKHFALTDLVQVRELVAEAAAADFVTVDDAGQPLATLMPCVWIPGSASSLDDGAADFGTLVMHMSRGNKQWESIQANARALAIVHGAQSYISPSNYAAKAEHGKVVPTWNYVSVHLSGTVEVNHGTDALRDIVTQLTDVHEARRAQPWKVSDAPETYLDAQLRGIVAITLHIDRVEAKAKLNQNRSIEDQQGVIRDLAASDKTDDQYIAALMQANVEQQN